MTRRNRIARARRMRSLTPYKPIQSVKRSVIHSAPNSFVKLNSQTTSLLSVCRSISQSLDQSTMPIHMLFDSEPETEPIGRVDPLVARSLNRRKRSRAPTVQPTHIVFNESIDESESSLPSEDSDVASSSESEAEAEPNPKRRRRQQHVDESAERTALVINQHAELSQNQSARRWSRHMELSIRSDPSLAVEKHAETNSSPCDYDADASDDELTKESDKRPVRLYQQPSIILSSGDQLFNQSINESDLSRSLSLPLSSVMQSPIESSPRYVQFSVATHRSLSQPSWMMSRDGPNNVPLLNSNHEDDLHQWSEQETDVYETDGYSSDILMFSPVHSSCETTDELPDSEPAYREYSLPTAIQLSDHYSDEEASDEEPDQSEHTTIGSTESSPQSSIVHSVDQSTNQSIGPQRVEPSPTTVRVKTLLRRAGIGMLLVAGAVPWAAALADYAGLDCGIGL